MFSSPSVQSDTKFPVDDIQEATPCELQLRLVSCFPIEAGRGVVFPAGTVVHNARRGDGFAKVQIDMVHDPFIAVPLEKPPNNKIMTLGDAVHDHTFVQRPKRDIVLDPAVPASS
uniref:DUF8039 domain-containing protein n=1 Tax=Arundo donax TaxID=35708 RepID=A0A0A9AMN1_ARUDO